MLDDKLSPLIIPSHLITKQYNIGEFSRLTETTVDDIIQQLPEIRHLSLVISNYHVEQYSKRRQKSTFIVSHTDGEVMWIRWEKWYKLSKNWEVSETVNCGDSAKRIEP
ncbi:hypothetical protein QTP88_011443 [Uroleucon formosanum]